MKRNEGGEGESEKGKDVGMGLVVEVPMGEPLFPEVRAGPPRVNRKAAAR